MQRFDEEKELGDKELQSQAEKKVEEKQRRETLTQVNIEGRELRRRQEESREKILSKLENVITPEMTVSS